MSSPTSSRVEAKSSSQAKERRQRAQPSEAFLARVGAVVDLLVESGMREDIATLVMAQRLAHPGAPAHDLKLWSDQISNWRVSFRSGAVSEEAKREYANMAAAIEAIEPRERVERTLESELWNRRRLNLNGRRERGCLIY